MAQGLDRQAIEGGSRAGLVRFVLLVIAPTLLVIPAAGLIFADPPEEDAEAWVRASLATQDYRRAREVLAGQIQLRPCDVRCHYLLLRAEFDEGCSEERAQELCGEYLEYTTRGDADLADIGFWGLGMIHLEMARPEAALHCLEKVQNRGLCYLHTLTGRGREALGGVEAAADEYRLEIDGGGDLAGATGWLSMLLMGIDDIAGLEGLYARPELRGSMPPSVLRRLSIRSRSPGRYARALAAGLHRSVNGVGVLGAAGILLAWAWFLRRLDLFEPEKLFWVTAAIGGGMLSTFAASMLYDAAHWTLGLAAGGGAWSDLAYSIFGIGLIEESAKIVPVLLIIRFSRQVDESIDYLIYASLCALGFSFVENLLYFDEYSLFVINERGMICSIGHMFYTSLACYGLVLARYRKRGTAVGNFALCFAAACVVHGVYDFFLITDSAARDWRGVSLLLALAVPVLYVRMLNNTLNQSEFFDPAKCRHFARMREYLGAAMVGILLIEYLGMASQYGPTLATGQYRPVIGFTWVLVLFLSMTLGTYRLRRREWRPWWGKGPLLTPRHLRSRVSKPPEEGAPV